MVLDLKLLFAGGDPVDIDYRFTPSQEDISGISEVRVSGGLKGISSVVYMKLRAQFSLARDCDRCTSEFVREYDIPVDHVLVTSINNEDNDELIVVEDFTLDLDELVLSDIQLALPMKHLCAPDCRGLCPHCGANLNLGNCGCSKNEIDPRLEILRRLIDEE